MNDLLRAVSGTGQDDVTAAFDGNDNLFELPTKTFTVATTLKVPGAEKMNGEVTIRYPNVGDDLSISRMQRALGDDNLAEAIATLSICIEKAPATWYSVPKGSGTPVLNLRRLPDLEALAQLFLNFNAWRSSFR